MFSRNKTALFVLGALCAGASAFAQTTPVMVAPPVNSAAQTTSHTVVYPVVSPTSGAAPGSVLATGMTAPAGVLQAAPGVTAMGATAAMPSVAAPSSVGVSSDPRLTLEQMALQVQQAQLAAMQPKPPLPAPRVASAPDTAGLPGLPSMGGLPQGFPSMNASPVLVAILGAPGHEKAQIALGSQSFEVAPGQRIGQTDYALGPIDVAHQQVKVIERIKVKRHFRYKTQTLGFVQPYAGSPGSFAMPSMGAMPTLSAPPSGYSTYPTAPTMTAPAASPALGAVPTVAPSAAPVR